jgi:RNA polymerase subunit RPABC4/transcription elongation factor Spt4
MFDRTSYTEEDFVNAVKNNYSVRSCLLALGLNATGGNYALFKRRVESLGLDTSHFTGKGHLKNRTHDWSKKKTLEEILVVDSSYTCRKQIKKRLLEKGLMTYRCSCCGIADWQGQPLSLHLDHINGVNNDHRLENLRLLCPNCHSQTSTYAGRNKPRKPRKKASTPKPRVKKQNFCVDCGVAISRRAQRCKSCQGKFSQPTKTEWPSVEELIVMVERTSYSAVGRKLGVSDNAVRKRIQRHKV